MIFKRLPARLFSTARPLLGTALPGWRISPLGWGLVGLAVMLALLPLLFFPLGPDQGLYFVSGQKILQGAVHYVDVIDLKPPLIYHLYALAIAIFGESPSGVRLADLLVQGFTCGMIALVVRRASGNDLWAASAAFLYAIIYVALSFNGTSLPESFTGAFALPMLYLLMWHRSPGGMLAAGVLAGALFLMKFTLAVLLVVALIAVLFLLDQPRGRRLGPVLMLLAGFAGTAALLPIYLTAGGAWDGFARMNEFIRGYVALQSSSPLAMIRTVIESLAAYFGRYFSIAMLLATTAAMLTSVTFSSEGEAYRRQSADQRRLLRVCTVALLLLVATVIAEGKYSSYIFSRIYPFAAVLAAFPVARWVMSRGADGESSSGRGYGITIAVLLLPLLLLFSPFPRYLHHAVGGLISAVRGDEGFDAYYGSGIFTRGELHSIDAYIDERSDPGDDTFVASGLGGLVYTYLDEVPPFGIYHSAYLIAPFAPQVWRDSTSAYLRRSAPRFIVAGRVDSMRSITGSGLASDAALRRIAGIDSMLRHRYDTGFQTPWFIVYERTGSLVH